jgi:hypothetical protein
MLCTATWMNEYYMEPFVRYHQGTPIIEINGIAVDEEDEISIALMLDRDYTQQGMVVTTVPDLHGEARPKREFPTCNGCLRIIPLNDEPCYRCIECAIAEYCHDCYVAGEHDQTHSFERVCRTSIESLKPQVQMAPGEDSALLPDVPLALAVPVESPYFPSSIASCEPVARAVGGVLSAGAAGASSIRTRRRGSECSSSTSSTASVPSSSRSHKKRARRIRKSQHCYTASSLSMEDDRKPVAE